MRRTHELSRLGHLTLHTFVKRNIKSLRRKKNQYTSVRKKIVYLRITNDDWLLPRLKWKFSWQMMAAKSPRTLWNVSLYKALVYFLSKWCKQTSRPISHRVPTEPSHGRQQTIHSTRRWQSVRVWKQRWVKVLLYK